MIGQQIYRYSGAVGEGGLVVVGGKVRGRGGCGRAGVLSSGQGAERGREGKEGGG